MTFKLSEDMMYHMPHNTAVVEEVLCLIDAIDLNKKSYTFSELSKLLLIKEIETDVFKDFHKKPYNQFTTANSQDKEKILNELTDIYNSQRIKNGMPRYLFDKLMNIGPEKTCNFLINNRLSKFEKFILDPEKGYIDLINVQYSITKTWKQNWVEFVRDIVDFCAYIGILPCYYKQLSNNSEEYDGYIISDQLRQIRDNKLSFFDIFLNFKYSNSSINTRRFNQFNIRVRPFYVGLLLLSKLKQRNINKLERRLFFATIACIKEEKNITEVCDYLQSFISQNSNVLSKETGDEKLAKEGGRVATGMQDFYIKAGFTEISKIGKCYYFSITKKGEDALKNNPPNSLFFGQVDTISGLIYSPLVASILMRFTDKSKNNKDIIFYDELIREYKNIEEHLIKDCLKNIQLLSPSPIKKITEKAIELNDFSHQYHITPYSDFCSIEEVKFIYSKSAIINIKTIYKPQIKLPPLEIIEELRKASISSDGTRYEIALHRAFLLLPGEVKRLGQATTAQRLSDIVWKVPISIDGEEKNIAIIIEAKAGNAIKSFDERKEVEDIRNTILYNRDLFKDVQGIWIMVINGNSIPNSEGHGGSRINNLQLSFSDKLCKIQINTLQEFGLFVLVTAFGVNSFIEYYTYLFTMCTESRERINPFVDQFFTKGRLFFDYRSYIKVLNNEEEIRTKLLI